MRKFLAVLSCALLLTACSSAPVTFIEKDSLNYELVCDEFKNEDFFTINGDIQDYELDVTYEVDETKLNEEQTMKVKVVYDEKEYTKDYKITLKDTLEPTIEVRDDFRLGQNTPGSLSSYVTVVDQNGKRSIPHKSMSDETSGYYTVTLNGEEIIDELDTSVKGIYTLHFVVDDGNGHVIEQDVEFSVVDFLDLYVSADSY